MVKLFLACRVQQMVVAVGVDMVPWERFDSHWTVEIKTKQKAKRFLNFSI